jgi:hypothetical protein
MMNVPEVLTSVTHPLVSSMYLKKDYRSMHDFDDVLVIETNFSHDGRPEDFDERLAELLYDLHDLQVEAERKVGHIDRVDIRAAA